MSAFVRRGLAVTATGLLMIAAVGCGSDGDDLEEFRTGASAAVAAAD